ncbi:MAG: UbiA family prenyltransferase [Candidatus Saccharibacteria bacterium]|nr:UbiA family prenyltransferase [Candidatus Saccharibacteria bacterium]
MMLLFAAIGDAATKQTSAYDYRLLLIPFLLGCLFIGATTVNDIADEEIDKINLARDKRRPLAVASAQKKQLYALNIIAFVVALIIAVTIEPILVILVLISAGLGYIYSMPPIKISHRGFLAPLLLPINYVLLPFLIGASLHLNGWSKEAGVLLLGLYVSFIGRIILKDFRDIKGDAMFGKRTFLVRYGAKKTCEVAGIAWVIGDLIVSSVFISTEPLLVILLQPFVVSIIFTLYRLSDEKQLARQLTLVNLVGRLGNSVALSILTVLTLRFYNYGAFKDGMLLFLVAAVSIYASYFLYDLYVKQGALAKVGHGLRK